MSDDRLQQLKRAWEGSGNVDAGAAYLRERVRAGELTRERLELAAYCGDPAASAAAPEVEPPVDVKHWVQGLEDWGERVQLRGLIEAVSVTLPVWESAGQSGTLFEETLDRCRAALQKEPERKSEEDEAFVEDLLGRVPEVMAQLGVDRIPELMAQLAVEPNEPLPAYPGELQGMLSELGGERNPLAVHYLERQGGDDPELAPGSRAHNALVALGMLHGLVFERRSARPGGLVARAFAGSEDHVLDRAIEATNAQAVRNWAGRQLARWALEAEAAA